MQTFKKVALILSVLALGAALGFFAASQQPVKSTTTQTDTPSIMKALTRLSATKIPRDALSCEVNGSTSDADGMTVNTDVLVGDFMAHYVSWSLLQNPTHQRSFVCEGKGIQQCTWSFGDHKPQEGWDRILRFKYSQTTGLVDPASLECIDVP
jgi:hypothetical protein